MPFDSSPTDDDLADQQSQQQSLNPSTPLPKPPAPASNPNFLNPANQQFSTGDTAAFRNGPPPVNPLTKGNLKPDPTSVNPMAAPLVQTDSEDAAGTLRAMSENRESELDALQSKMNARAQARPSDGPRAQVPQGFFKPGTPTLVVGSPYRDAQPLGRAANLHPTGNQNEYNTWAAQQNGSQIQSLHPAAGQQEYKQSEMSKQLGETPQMAQWIDQQANLRGGRITALGTYDGGEWHQKTHGFARATLAKEYNQGQNQAVTDPAATAYAARQVSLNGGRTGRGIFQEGQWKGRSSDSVMEELKRQYQPGIE